MSSLLRLDKNNPTLEEDTSDSQKFVSGSTYEDQRENVELQFDDEESYDSSIYTDEEEQVLIRNSRDQAYLDNKNNISNSSDRPSFLERAITEIGTQQYSYGELMQNNIDLNLSSGKPPKTDKIDFDKPRLSTFFQLILCSIAVLVSLYEQVLSSKANKLSSVKHVSKITAIKENTPYIVPENTIKYLATISSEIPIDIGTNSLILGFTTVIGGLMAVYFNKTSFHLIYNENEGRAIGFCKWVSYYGSIGVLFVLSGIMRNLQTFGMRDDVSKVLQQIRIPLTAVTQYFMLKTPLTSSVSTVLALILVSSLTYNFVSSSLKSPEFDLKSYDPNHRIVVTNFNFENYFLNRPDRTKNMLTMIQQLTPDHCTDMILDSDACKTMLEYLKSIDITKNLNGFSFSNIKQLVFSEQPEKMAVFLKGKEFDRQKNSLSSLLTLARTQLKSNSMSLEKLAYFATVANILLGTMSSVLSEKLLKVKQNQPFYIQKMFIETSTILFCPIISIVTRYSMFYGGAVDRVEDQATFVYPFNPFVGWNINSSVRYYLVAALIFFLIKSWCLGYISKQIDSMMTRITSVITLFFLYFTSIIHSPTGKQSKTDFFVEDIFGTLKREIKLPAILSISVVLLTTITYIQVKSLSRKLKDLEKAI